MTGGTVRVLGELAVDGVDLRVAVDRKARALLRLLALARGRAVPADLLAEALWPDGGPARPSDQVAVLASRVRRVLGRDALVHGDGGYRLVGVVLDLDELESVVTETERRRAAGIGAASTARVVLSLLRGPLPDPDTAASWALADHQAAARLVRRGRAAATAALLDGGSWPEALELARADLEADPFDEVAARAVMRAEVAAGRPAAALQAFADLRTTLAEELGSDPGPETVALNTEILRGSPTPPARTTPRLVGRASQLEHLDTLVSRLGTGNARVALVHGEAGIGKTTLLRAWAQGRTDLGDLVLTGTCGALDASLPLDVVLAAIEAHLRRSEDPAGVLGDDGAVLGPLLGNVPGTPPRAVPDPAHGPATLYAAVTRVLERLATTRRVVLVLDDAHLGGSALADWLTFVLRRPSRLLVVVAARAGEGIRPPATDTIGLGPLGLSETAELVGPERAAELHERSAGHPLFLAALAGGAAGDDLPSSLVAAVRERCDQLGATAELVRSAAVLGGDLDVDVLGAVLGLPALEVLRQVETAAERDLLVERDGRYAFRHDLVRSALAAGTPAARAALLHREAAHVLAERSDVDPVRVAEHARLGGDRPLAASALVRAAERASARFDHATAAALLTESLSLAPTPGAGLARARVRIRLGQYEQAEADGLAETSADGSEAAAWAAYFDRRFDDAVQHAEDSEAAATDDPTRARALIAGGRIRHARGDLAAAEQRLREAAALASGPDRLTASAWLGVLLAHRSQPEEALALLRPATHPGVGVEHTSAALHALLFTGHAHALAGRSEAALAAFARYTEEVERRQVPRFAGRGLNFGGWVLRNLGACAEAKDAHLAAVATSGDLDTAELAVAAHEDLAEEALRVGDLDLAAQHLDAAALALTGDLVFGWRLAAKLRLHRARLALARGQADEALTLAQALAAESEQAGVPRYASVAAVLGHQATAALGGPVDLDAVAGDLRRVESSVLLEAWWWTGDTAAALGSERLLARARELAAALAGAAGPHAESVRAEADRRLAGWSLSVR